MLINVKMPTTVGILTFISMINTTSESLEARKALIFGILAFMISWNFVLMQMSWAWKKFYNLWARLIWAATWDFQQCGMCNQQRLRPACAYTQSDQRLCMLLEYSMTVQLLAEHHLEFLSLKRGCTGLSESTLVRMPHCWKSRVTANLFKKWIPFLAFLEGSWNH